MNRFFLNVRKDGVFIPDPDGDELPDADAARALGVETLRHIRNRLHFYGEDWRTNELVITNENGQHIVTLTCAMLD